MIIAPPENSFGKHHIYSLAADGDVLRSRNDAERVIGRCSSTSEVLLDFGGVESIGPEFARHILEGWPKVRHQTKVVMAHTNPSVDRMLRRVKAGHFGNGSAN